MAALPRGFFFRGWLWFVRCWYLGGLRFRNIWCRCWCCRGSRFRCWYLGGLRFTNIWCWCWSHSRFWCRGCGQYFPIVCVQNRGILVRNAAGLFCFSIAPAYESIPALRFNLHINPAILAQCKASIIGFVICKKFSIVRIDNFNYVISLISKGIVSCDKNLKLARRLCRFAGVALVSFVSFVSFITFQALRACGALLTLVTLVTFFTLCTLVASRACCPSITDCTSCPRQAGFAIGSGVSLFSFVAFFAFQLVCGNQVFPVCTIVILDIAILHAHLHVCIGGCCAVCAFLHSLSAVQPTPIRST